MATLSEALVIAVQHHQAGRLQAAENICQQILAVDPDHAETLHLLGVVAFQLGNHEVSIQQLGRAIELNGTDSSFHRSLGTAFQAQGKLDEAIACFCRALELKPDYAEAHYRLGTAFQAQGKPDDAIACHRRALELKPDYPRAHYHLGITFQTQGKLEEAINCHRRALELEPDYPRAHYNLGIAFHQLRRFDDALMCYTRALELKPDYREAHLSRSVLRLLRGDFEAGWPEFEWRWKTNQLVERKFSQPVWDGKPLEDRTILLHAEQGFGDTIQFVRYAALVKEQNPAATVIVGCQRPLEKLLARCHGIDRLIAEGDDLPSFDVHSPLLSLPQILKTTVETIPANVPYVFASPELVSHWRKCLSQVHGLRVGVNWQSRSGQGEFRNRDIAIEYLIALAQLPGVRLISLQKGEGRDELASASEHLPILDLGPDFDTMHGAFVDTAAVMMNLDLVISSDTSVPHLAGALGVPVWLALPYVSDWRWLLDRSDSPWYPTMRLFRQTSPGNWPGVFEEMKAALGLLCPRVIVHSLA